MLEVLDFPASLGRIGGGNERSGGGLDDLATMESRSAEVEVVLHRRDDEKSGRWVLKETKAAS